MSIIESTTLRIFGPINSAWFFLASIITPIVILPFGKEHFMLWLIVPILWLVTLIQWMVHGDWLARQRYL